MRVTPAGTALGAGLTLLVFAHVTDSQYGQIEWHISTPVPLVWSVCAKTAATLGVPLFGVAVGHHLARRATPANLSWYALSTAACAVLLWRIGPVYGLTPIRDVPELVRQVTLPPPGLVPAYALAVFPLLAKLVNRLPTAVVLGVTAGAAVLAAVLTGRFPGLTTTAGLLEYLVFFVLGLRFGATFEMLLARADLRWFLLSGAGLAAVAVAAEMLPTGPTTGIRTFVLHIAALPGAVTGTALLVARPAVSRALTRVARDAGTVAAALVPATALAGALAVKRLSVWDGAAQTVVAVAESVLLAAAVVATGPILRRLLPHRRAAPGARVTR